MHEFLLDVGNVREPRELAVQVIRKVYALIPYDQARVYFVDNDGKVCDAVLVGVDPTWNDVYLDYYSRIENGRWSIPARVERSRDSIPGTRGKVYDWTKLEHDEFVDEYIRPQRLHYTAGFAFLDAGGLVKSVYCLDRTGRGGYTQREIDIMSIVQPHLDNLHQNLFVLASARMPALNADVCKLLTKRESQIARVLCQGMTPARISRALFVSLPTVYRHIANIHAKLDVSNRQELILKLLSSQEQPRS